MWPSILVEWASLFEGLIERFDPDIHRRFLQEKERDVAHDSVLKSPGVRQGKGNLGSLGATIEEISFKMIRSPRFFLLRM